MKKYLTIYIAIAVITLSFATSNYAQFGNILNKAKDAIDKKKDKNKKEEPTVNQTTNSDSTTGNSNDTKPNTQTVTESPLGTIYFSNQPFPAGGGTEGAKTSFSSSEFIYGRLVLKGGTVSEILKPVAPDKEIKGYNINFENYYINNTSYTPFVSPLGRISKAIIAKEDLGKTYWDFDLLPNPTNSKSLFYWGGNPMDGMTYQHNFYLFMDNSLTKEGNYEIWTEIKLDAKDFRGDPLPASEQKQIKNSFTFNFRGTDFATVKANHEKIKTSFESNYKNREYENQEVPKQWNEKSSPLLAGITLAKLQSIFLSGYTNGSDVTVLKIYVSPPESTVLWKIEKNDLGIPKYRYSSHWFIGFGKTRKTGNCFFQEFYLEQNYSGGGTYGPIYSRNPNENGPTQIQCEKLGVK